MSERVPSVLLARIIALLLLVVGPAGAALVPLDHQAYRDIAALRARGYAIIESPTIRPWSDEQIRRGVARVATATEGMSPYERQLFDRLQREFAPDTSRWLHFDANPRAIALANQGRVEQPRTFRLPATRGEPDDPVRNINTLDATTRISEHVSTGHRLEMDTDGLGDYDYGGPLESYRLGSTGYVAAGYIRYENEWCSVTAGRVPMEWGPGAQGNLTASDNAPAADGIRLDAHYRWLHFTSYTAELRGYRTINEQTVSRFFAGHRLVLTPRHWIEIGMGETVVYGGIGRSWSMRWSNPMLFLLAEEINKTNERDDNLNASWDLTLRPTAGVEVYGVLHMDDVALDKKSPDRLAWIGGVRWEAPLGWDRAGLNVEYVRISRWVYNYANSDPYNRYINGRGVLGHFLGPDGETVFLTGTWESASEWRAILSATHRRQGDTRWNSRFPVNESGANFGYRHEDFPHGIIETTTSAELQIVTPEFHGARLGLTGTLRRVDNEANALTDPKWRPGARVELDWHLRGGF